MNKQDQKKISKMISELQEMQEKAETLLNELETKLDSRSETYKESEKGTRDGEDVYNLQDAVASIEAAVDALSNIETSEM